MQLRGAFGARKAFGDSPHTLSPEHSQTPASLQEQSGLSHPHLIVSHGDDPPPGKLFLNGFLYPPSPPPSPPNDSTSSALAFFFLFLRPRSRPSARPPLGDDEGAVSRSAWDADRRAGAARRSDRFAIVLILGLQVESSIVWESPLALLDLNLNVLGRYSPLCLDCGTVAEHLLVVLSSLGRRNANAQSDNLVPHLALPSYSSVHRSARSPGGGGCLCMKKWTVQLESLDWGRTKLKAQLCESCVVLCPRSPEAQKRRPVSHQCETGWRASSTKNMQSMLF